MAEDTKQQDEWPWAAVFIEVVLRAMRRVHYEYGLWGLGHHWKMNRAKAARMNTGLGIELADEVTVCAAITQEFIGSPSLAGLWEETGDDGKTEPKLRYFEIDRETTYERSRERVDMFVRRLAPKGNTLDGDLKQAPYPSFIEAKRAWRVSVDIPAASVGKAVRQVDKVQDDVEKLLAEILHRRKEKKDEIRGHVLVWGVARGKVNYHQEDPKQFFSEIYGVKPHALRWLPLHWEQPTWDKLKTGDFGLGETTTALWVCLAEVDV